MILAETASAPTDVILQYGAIGAIAVILGWFAWNTVKRERDRADHLFELLQQRDARAVEAATDVVKAVGVLADLRDDLRDIIRRDGGRKP